MLREERAVPAPWLTSVQRELTRLITDASGRVGIVIRDVDTDGEVSCGAQEAFPSASVIKVPALIAALHQAETGRLDLDRPVRVPLEARVPGSGVLKDLQVEELPVRDLLTLMIVLSDNTATNVCFELVGFDAVNDVAQRAGCTQTKLGRLMMDDEARALDFENETSPADMALLLARLARGELLGAAGTAHGMDVLRRQRSWRGLPRLLPEDVDLAHKTGELSGLRHDVGLLRTGDRRAAVAVLCDGFTDPSTRDGYRSGEANDLHGEVGRILYAAMLTHER